MIAATYNCGCPARKQPSLITAPVGLRAPCSPCCFRPSHHLQRQIVQRRIQSTIVERPKRIYPIPKDGMSCCIKRKNARCAPTCSERIPSAYLSSIPPQCSKCCAVGIPRMLPKSSRRPISAAATCASKESVSKQFSKSKSESKLKEETSNMERTPTDKVVSQIVRKGQPYKEIEAIINDNRVIIRTHKESVKEEYDPPCECVGQEIAKESTSSLEKRDNGVVFDMADGNLKLGRTSRKDALSAKKICDREEMGCRTVTLYPNIKDGDGTESVPAPMEISPTEIEETKKTKTVRTIDLEENPNIFLLRIRKQCDSSDKKRKIDLEFRAPRPWLPRNDVKKQLRTNLFEKLDEHEDNSDDENKIIEGNDE